jgi:hypothetical protein
LFRLAKYLLEALQTTIYLNTLKVVENTKSMVKAMGLFIDSQGPSWLSGPGPMYRLNHPLICLVITWKVLQSPPSLGLTVMEYMCHK